jgi:hypothetical protein
MNATCLEMREQNSSSVSPLHIGHAYASYRNAATSSKDVGTHMIKNFQTKAIALSRYQILVNLQNEFVGKYQTCTKVPQTMTVDGSLGHPDLARAETRLEYLANLNLTDSFEDLSPLTSDVIREAGLLLRKFASLGRECFLPDLGLDSDGTIVFSFHPDRSDLVGSLSVYGDGTYSYCIELDGKSVRSGAAPIQGPIARDLQSLLVRSFLVR